MAMDCEPEDEGDDAELEEGDRERTMVCKSLRFGSLDGKDDQTARATGGRRDLERDEAERGMRSGPRSRSAISAPAAAKADMIAS